MIGDFGTLGLFVVFAIAFAFFLIATPLTLKYLGAVPNNPSSTKNSPYECGMTPFGDARTQMNFHYYTYAIIFVALDVMSVFLFPWAVNFGRLTQALQGYSFVAILVFIAILLIGFAYAWRKKALEWK
ncbi:MAG: NADH-quinone oxidoreductase subunit A [Dehalococcoidia bacterium]